MTNNFEAGMDNLLKAIREGSERKYMDTVQDMIKKYDYLDIRNPEDYNLLISQTLAEQEEILVSLALAHIELDEKEKHKLEFLYTQYEFVEHQLDNFILKFEGFACSSDKVRWLLNNYIIYLTKNTVAVIDEKKFWHPAYGEVKEWFDWIDTFYLMYYKGEIIPYVQNQMVLIKRYTNRKEREKQPPFQ